MMNAFPTALRLFAAVAASALCAAADVSFGPARNYPAAGLIFPVLRDALPDPLPSPRAFAYLPANLSDTLSREDRFYPFELWYADQCCGRWRDASGHYLTLGRMTRLYPRIAESHVSRERFALELARAPSLPDPDKRDQLNLWVATFAGVPVYPPQKLDANKFALAEALSYPTDTNLLVFAFRPRRVGYKDAPPWFCATLRLADTEAKPKESERFAESFLSKLALPSKADDADAVHSQTFTADGGDSAKNTGKPAQEPFPPSPVRTEARKSVENYPDWWVAEADGLIILSDVYSEVGKSLLRDLQAELPRLARAYAALLPPLAPMDKEVLVIRLFQHQEDYVRYLGPGMAWSVGAWTPSRRELVLFQKAGIEELLPTIRHEFLHQYLSYAYAMIPAAPWLNEGHACLAETAYTGSKGQTLFAPDDARARAIGRDPGLAAALIPSLLSCDYDEFYSGTPAEKNLKYSLAWGLAWFLQKGLPDVTAPSAFAGILPAYSKALAKTRDPAKATAAAFDGIDMEAFQAAFKAYFSRH
jgi:hypothetical protein